MSRAARLEPNAWQTPVLRLVPPLAVAPLPVEGDPLDFPAGVGSATARVPSIGFLMALVALYRFKTNRMVSDLGFIP